MSGRWLVVFSTVFYCGSGIFGQLSPGDLHQAHAHLEGLTNCTSCHELGNHNFTDRCLSCHQLLKTRIEKGLGLHAGPEYADCTTCHVDHHGRDFKLINWGEKGIEGFDHRQTGYSLTGKHSDQKCRSCHQSKNLVDLATIKAAGKDPDVSFMGLDTRCRTCHEDVHQGKLAQDCASCHTTANWPDTPGFDHQKTEFPLVGAHGKTSCENCHVALKQRTSASVLFGERPFKECGDCHKDPHEGRLSNNCASCHNEDAWRPAPGFDHSHTQYALTGSHKKVQCEACHKTAAGQLVYRGLAHESCSDCHKDPHQKRLGQNCASCHSTSSWQSYNQKAFSHDKTRYPLTGLHSRVACERCHVPGSRKTLKFDQCNDCHKDPHLGQLSQNRACEACHDVAGFLPSAFGVQEHQQSRFPLENSHLAIPCIACHRDVTSDLGRTHQYHFDSLECIACHADPHQGKATAAVGPEADCTSCHNSISWDASVFNHKLTGFDLSGAHERVLCRSCHDLEKQVFKASSLCQGCHQDIHLGQFKDSPVFVASGCEGCHVTRDWLAEKFDHQRHTSFSLDGAHQRTPCSACHPQETRQGQTFVRYQGIDSQCKSCHAVE